VFTIPGLITSLGQKKGTSLCGATTIQAVGYVGEVPGNIAPEYATTIETKQKPPHPKPQENNGGGGLELKRVTFPSPPNTQNTNSVRLASKNPMGGPEESRRFLGNDLPGIGGGGPPGIRYRKRVVTGGIL